MLNYLKFKIKLKNLYKTKSKLQNAYQYDIKAAYEQNVKNEKIEYIRDCAYHETRMIDEEISLLVTDYWLEISNQYFLPLPSKKDEDMWEECCIMSRRKVLTNKGISELRSELYTYKDSKYRTELKLITALTGMVGAATGLLAIILTK